MPSCVPSLKLNVEIRSNGCHRAVPHEVHELHKDVFFPNFAKTSLLFYLNIDKRLDRLRRGISYPLVSQSSYFLRTAK